MDAIGAGMAFTIILGLIGVVYGFNRSDISKAKEVMEVLKERVQRLEDVQGNNIHALQGDVKDLSGKVDKLAEKVQVLASNVHNQKNTEGQLNQTLNLILKHFQDKEQ